MPEKGHGRSRRWLKRFAVTDFEMFPLSLAREGQKSRKDKVSVFRSEDQRAAEIRKREANPPAPCDRATHVHQGKERRQISILGEPKIDRLVTVSGVEYLRPGSGVKKGTFRMRSHIPVPVG